MFSIAVGVLLFCSLIFLLRGRWLSLVVGFVLMGNAANLLIFSVSEPRRNAYPFLNQVDVATDSFSDPLPQALILTAIVIAFAILCFLIAILKRVADEYGLQESSDLYMEEDS